MPRDAYSYTYRVGDKILRRGITNNPDRRERDLQQAYPGGKLTVDGKAEIRGGRRYVEGPPSKFRGYHH